VSTTDDLLRAVVEDILMHLHGDVAPGWVCIPIGEWEGSIRPRLEVIVAKVNTTDDLLRAVREFLDSHAELMGHTWPVDSDEYSKWVLRDNAAFWRLYEVHAEHAKSFDDLLRVRTNQMIHGQRSPQRGDDGGTRDDDT